VPEHRRVVTTTRSSLFWAAAWAAEKPGYVTLLPSLVAVEEALSPRGREGEAEKVDSPGRTALRRAPEAHDEHRAPADGPEVNGAIKRDRDPRLEVEAVERVDDIDVLASGRTRVAVGLG
jgi:hypothetical protein